MKTEPSGRLLPVAHGRDLVITRRFRAPIEDVWSSITESERTARWFASWTGTPGVGRTITYVMGFEGSSHEGHARIDACDEPHHLALTTLDGSGEWRLEIHLTESDGVTELRFTHHLTPDMNVGDIGPGWEYYLDMLVASRENAPQPQWADYYPGQKEYYLKLAQETPAGEV